MQLTALVPIGKTDPDDGLQVIVPQDPEGLAYVTVAPHWFAELFAWISLGHVIEHVALVTVTVKLQLSPVLLLQFTVVLPTPKLEPEGGAHRMVSPEQPLPVGDE